ncbi:MAG TPA: arginine--tRNA ligase, partial [Clostridia bacterium]|nr:arginine--tRNA ligase [Clostridia bacterium]
MDKKQEIALLLWQALQTQFEIDAPAADDLAEMLEIPPDPKLGDFAFPCFRLAKTLRKAPPLIAKTLAEAWTDGKTADVQCVGGYLNFFLKREGFARELLDAFLAHGADYGKGDEGAGKTVCIDYSSVNIAKRFHIGHLSTTMIGHSLKRIFEFLGYRVVGINHLGDWGTQFGKLISAYKRWGSKEVIEQGGIQALVDIYVRFHEEAERQPELEDEGRAWFKKIETGDEEALALFNWFKDITMLDVQRVYDLLNVSFDSYAGESFYIDKMDRVVEELKDKGLLVESDGAFIVDLEAYNMPPCLILKRDGATLYTTRDIAAAIYRHDTYNFDKSLYVVAYHQDLHFRQLFKVVELMGYSWAKDLVHVSYGMVSFEGQALSTRKGHVVYLEDVLARSMEKALSIIEEKSPGLQDKADVARQVGIGAAVFAFLTNNRIKDVDFWWDRVLN